MGINKGVRLVPASLLEVGPVALHLLAPRVATSIGVSQLDSSFVAVRPE